MATIFTWKVDSLITDPNDDYYITEVTAKVFGTEGSVTKATTVSCVFPGDKASVGSDFKSLEDLKKSDGETIILDWMFLALQDYKIKKVEKSVQNLIDTHNSKVFETIVKAADTAYSAQPTETPTPSE